MKYMTALHCSFAFLFGAAPVALTACSSAGSEPPVVEGPTASVARPSEYRHVEVRRGSGAVARWSLATRVDGALRIDALDASAKPIGSWVLTREGEAGHRELVIRSSTRAGTLRVDPRGHVLEATLEDRAIIAALGDIAPTPARARNTQLITDDGTSGGGDSTGGGSGGGGDYADGWSMPDMPAENGDWECTVAIAAAVAACASVAVPVTWPAALGCASAVAAAKIVCGMKPSCIQSDCNIACQQVQHRLGGLCYPGAGCVCSDLPLCHPTCPGTGGGSNTSNSSSGDTGGQTPGSGGSSCKEGSFPYTCNGQDAGCATSIMDAWNSC